MDFEQARFNMIEQQVRPWDVLDQSVLDLLFVVKREDFVPPEYRALAFSDMEIPLRIGGVDTGDSMWSPKLEARILQEIAIKRHDLVLEIGSGSGYMAALLAHKARQVVSVEIDPRLQVFGAANLARAGVHNVRLESGDASRGWPARAPYDVIVVTGSLPVLPDILRRQLKVGGRLAVVIGSDPIMSAELITRVSDTGFDAVTLFETRLKPLHNAERPSSFRF
ncbi:MAG TPA: protein-L-isoaspartate O-methyltransferase [Burkholderiaceae bacterium]|nr:protein-L-isoaspartate O-methyltransferase [Burkholderiaceae bacterium]